MHRLNIKLIKPDPKEDFTAYKEVYIQSQFLYSQLLREKYVNSNYQVKSLKQYLDRNYYKAIVKEIELKRNSGTVDETIVDSVIFEEVAHLDKSLLLAKLTVLGKDKEIQFNQDFDTSFSRNKWTDYVIFGLEDNRIPKIINLVYGTLMVKISTIISLVRNTLRKKSINWVTLKSIKKCRKICGIFISSFIEVKLVKLWVRDYIKGAYI